MRVVILGGGYAGMMAAARLAGAGDVTLVDAKEHFEQRIRLHEALAGSAPASASYGEILGRRGVRFVQGRVDGIDLASKEVRIGDDALPFDYLVYALGSRVKRLPGAYAIDSAEEARALAAKLASLPEGESVDVCGAGLTGLETATELAERFPKLLVTLYGAGKLDGFSEGGEEYVREELKRLGVRLVENTRLSQAKNVTVAWTGFEVPALAREAGLAVDDQGRILVDDALRSQSHPFVIAAGDAATVTLGDETLRMACATAMPMGAHAGETVLRLARGAKPKSFRFAFAVRCVSLGRGSGIVQRVDAHDRTLPSFLGGRPAALVKELICRFTFSTILWELRSGLPLYVWPKGDKRAA